MQFEISSNGVLFEVFIGVNFDVVIQLNQKKL